MTHKKLNKIKVISPEQKAKELTEYNLMFMCRDCHVNTNDIDEYYMVNNSIWKLVCPDNNPATLLCIGCLENSLGRKLMSTDFTEAPINYIGLKSKRLADRLGQSFILEYAK